jgi:hypothetical protein
MRTTRRSTPTVCCRENTEASAVLNDGAVRPAARGGNNHPEDLTSQPASHFAITNPRLLHDPA